MQDLTPFELAPLVGPGATLEQLRTAAGGLAGGWALECLVDGTWTAVGYTGTEERAREWVETGDDPTC